MTELHKKIFSNLLIHCNSFDIGGSIGTGEKENSLFLRPENLGIDNSGSVVSEVCFVPVDDSKSAFIQINTTLLDHIDMSRLPEILVHLNSLNTYCLAGHYGVYTDSAQLYHKHILIVNNCSDEVLSDTLITTVDLILDILNRDYVPLTREIREVIL